MPSFFDSLTQADREALMANAIRRKVRRGTFLSRARTTVTEILILLEGNAKICRATASGKETTIALLGPGAHIGIMTLLTKTARADDVIATCSCQVLAIDAKRFCKLLQVSPSLSFQVMLSLAERLKQTSLHLAENALYGLPQRLALRLFELAELVEFDGKQCLLVRQRPSHQELANMLGVTREAITRALQQLEREEHIIVDDSQIFITSTPRP